jgi:CheY-like chemotaxis protein
MRLELEGHQTRRALGGESALAVASGFQPKAAILDIGLPGMDGYELARRLRAQNENGAAAYTRPSHRARNGGRSAARKGSWIRFASHQTHRSAEVEPVDHRHIS